MKPPVCSVCGADFTLAPTAQDPWISLVSFVDAKKMPPGVGGHPIGIEWFCREHYGAALSLVRLPASEALAELRRREGLDGNQEPASCPVGIIFTCGDGVEGKMMGLLRRMFGVSLADARELTNATVVFAELELGFDIQEMTGEAEKAGVFVTLGKAPVGAARVPRKH